MVNICVIALVGLPGAGKTTFCKHILQIRSEYNFIHICFDDLFKFHPEENIGGETFKNQRKQVLQSIEQKICELRSTSEANSLNVILVDDNNYYAGMRYEIFKICKANQLSFGQVYIPLELDCALQRNASRGLDSLPPQVIKKMNSRLEKPSNKNQWERYTLLIKNISEELEEFCTFLKHCFQNPLITASSKATSVEYTKVNFVHEVDVCLRKRIKEILDGSVGNVSEKANLLNKKRKSILSEIRHKSEVGGFDEVQKICDDFESI